MERTGKGEWEREWATLVEGRGETTFPSRVYIAKGDVLLLLIEKIG